MDEQQNFDELSFMDEDEEEKAEKAKKKKRRIAIFAGVAAVVLCLVLVIVLVTCSQSKKKGSEGLEYALSADGSYYTVVGMGTCTDTEVVIPATYKDIPVTDIGASAFAECRAITSITIPEYVTYIYSYAFMNCYALEEVNYNATSVKVVWEDREDIFYQAGDSSGGFVLNIGSNVTEIPSYLFRETNVISIVFAEDSVCESIGDYAFYNCYSLINITMPDSMTSMTSIGGSAFYNCYRVTSITIPDSVTSIGWGAFEKCIGLTSITIPDSVTNIWDSAFASCYRLVEVYNLSSLVITAGSSSNGYVAYYALGVHTSKEETSYLTTTEDGYVFYDDGTTVALVGYNGSEIDLVLPDRFNGKSYEIYYGAFYYCDSLISVTIGNGVMSIESYAFQYCFGLTSVTIPESVTSIGQYAFHCCNLTSAIFEDVEGWYRTSYWDSYHYSIDVSDPEMAAEKLCSSQDRFWYKE